MRKARVWDCETTGFPEQPGAELVEVGFVDVDLDAADHQLLGSWQSLVEPIGPIPPEAKAVHHLTERDLVGQPSAELARAALRDGMHDGDVFVAHNAKFEQAFFDAGNIPWVCTLKCAYRAWPEAPGHSNQVLRYWLGIEDEIDRDLAMPPHRALPDAYVTAHIFRRLLTLRPVERLIEISNEPGFLPKFRFGKHAGKSFKAVAVDDRSYLDWIVNKSDMDEDVKFTAKHWLDKTGAA